MALIFHFLKLGNHTIRRVLPYIYIHINIYYVYIYILQFLNLQRKTKIKFKPLAQSISLGCICSLLNVSIFEVGSNLFGATI